MPLVVPGPGRSPLGELLYDLSTPILSYILRILNFRKFHRTAFLQTSRCRQSNLQRLQGVFRSRARHFTICNRMEKRLQFSSKGGAKTIHKKMVMVQLISVLVILAQGSLWLSLNNQFPIFTKHFGDNIVA